MEKLELMLKSIQDFQDFKKNITAYIFFSAGFCGYSEQSCFPYFKNNCIQWLKYNITFSIDKINGDDDAYL